MNDNDQAQPCHSERSEESVSLGAEILSVAKNDSPDFGRYSSRSSWGFTTIHSTFTPFLHLFSHQEYTAI
jgi:hypothetical protein